MKVFLAAVAVAPAACGATRPKVSANASQFTHFASSCRDAFGDDVLVNAFPAGAESLAACRAACSESSAARDLNGIPTLFGCAVLYQTWMLRQGFAKGSDLTNSEPTSRKLT